MTENTTSESFFEAKYQADQDPWNFAGSPYEQARYSAIIAVLQGRSFKRALEPGCSVGILTERLARICNQVYALDISQTAALEAKKRCRHLANVQVEHASLRDPLPAGQFDLIVMSEIGYYFKADELTTIAARLFSRLDTGGLLLAAHWLGTSSDHVLNGDEVHRILAGIAECDAFLSQRHPDFRIDLWIKQ